MPVTEGLREPVSLFIVVEVKEPVRQLAEAVLEPRVPLRVRAARLLLEDAVGPAVLELDHAEVSGRLAPHEQVGSVVAEKRELVRQVGRRSDVRGEGSQEGRQMLAGLEQRLDVAR